jgi:hypothetical protein
MNVKVKPTVLRYGMEVPVGSKSWEGGREESQEGHTND